MQKNVFIFQKNVLCLPQNLHDRIIMLRIMREGAARAILDPSAIFLEIPGIPGAVLQAVHGAVAEQAVEPVFVRCLVAWKKLALSVVYEFIVFCEAVCLCIRALIFLHRAVPPSTHHKKLTKVASPCIFI